MKIVFTSASSLLDIHIEDCVAHNNKYKKVDGKEEFVTPLEKITGFNDLELVEADCFKTGGKYDIIEEGDYFIEM